MIRNFLIMNVALKNPHKIPVIIIHRGMQPYLKYTLEITSKNNEVILIGDKEVSNLSKDIDNIHFVNISSYEIDNHICKFKENFKNFSTNDSEFEWRCFERVFILKKFMQESNLKQIFHLDSDAVLLVDINDLIFNEECAYMIPNHQKDFRMDSSIHFGLIDLNFCDKFQNLYKEIYIDETKLFLIQDKINFHKKNNIRGGICDMTLYYLLNEQKHVKPQNLMKEIKDINNNEYVFINNINLGEGFHSLKNFKMKGNYIKISKKSIYDLTQEKFLKVAGIHFQGSAKKRLNKFLKFRLYF